jgi:hypothetical protein
MAEINSFQPLRHHGLLSLYLLLFPETGAMNVRDLKQRQEDKKDEQRTESRIRRVITASAFRPDGT